MNIESTGPAEFAPTDMQQSKTPEHETLIERVARQSFEHMRQTGQSPSLMGSVTPPITDDEESCDDTDSITYQHTSSSVALETLLLEAFPSSARTSVLNLSELFAHVAFPMVSVTYDRASQQLTIIRDESANVKVDLTSTPVPASVSLQKRLCFELTFDPSKNTLSAQPLANPISMNVLGEDFSHFIFESTARGGSGNAQIRISYGHLNFLKRSAIGAARAVPGLPEAQIDSSQKQICLPMRVLQQCFIL